VKIKLSQLRRLVREAIIREEAWVPGRFYPSTNEPLSPDEQDRLNQNLGEDDEEDLDEVDTDPSNNPGRPADPYEYLGMHPSPTAAMSHPSAGGSSGAGPAEPSDGESGPPETG